MPTLRRSKNQAPAGCIGVTRFDSDCSPITPQQRVGSGPVVRRMPGRRTVGLQRERSMRCCSRPAPQPIANLACASAGLTNAGNPDPALLPRYSRDSCRGPEQRLQRTAPPGPVNRAYSSPPGPAAAEILRLHREPSRRQRRQKRLHQ